MASDRGVSGKKKPTGIAKWFMQSPKWIFRARLGFVFGSRFLLLESIGRRSGVVRQTPLEVAHHDPDRDEYIVASGTGVKADWYRNIQANPAVAIWVGSRRYPTAQRFLPTEEAVAVMMGYERDHPKTAARLESMMGVSHDDTRESWMAMMEQIPMIGFTPDRAASTQHTR
jgi:deazaflavin-dependent oxidoreductase (nitroreductase family)